MAESLRKPRVLVVDNNVSSLLVFRRQLRLAPCLLETVRSVRMALAVVQARDVSLVVAEQLLPDGSGAELLAEIAVLYPNARRLLLADAADVPTQPPGVNPHYRLFVRPFNMRDLVGAILSSIEEVAASYVVGSVVSRPAAVLSAVDDTDAGGSNDTLPLQLTGLPTTAASTAATRVMQAVPDMMGAIGSSKTPAPRPSDDTAPIPYVAGDNTEPHQLDHRPGGSRTGGMAVVGEPVRAALFALVDWLESRVYVDDFVQQRGHGERVARLAAALATELACPSEEVACIEVAARLHDLGELLVGKPLAWSREQTAAPPDGEDPLVRDHIDAFDGFVQQTHLDGDVAAAIYHHHERWDGHGYPLALSEEVIPLSARIVAVADAWDAIVHGRAYRPPVGTSHLPTAEAEAALRTLAGTVLDPTLVERFLHRRLFEQVVGKVLV